MGEPDYQLAKVWYQKAADKLPKAAVALGFLYETVDNNYQTALAAYNKAAQLGDAFGQYNVALIYEYGKGYPVDYHTAQNLLNAAADKGLDAAMYQVASLYFYGLGQPRNEELALSWYKKAASLGNSNSLYALGLLSETGWRLNWTSLMLLSITKKLQLKAMKRRCWL